MFLETILGLILIFLVIIAIQNCARGGMQADCLHTIIEMTNGTRAAVDFLARDAALNRKNNLKKPLITQEESCKN
jgi:hypothetical protein